MPAKRLFLIGLIFCFLVSSLLACDVLPPITIDSTSDPSQAEKTGLQGTPELNVWKQSNPGIEYRYERWKSEGKNEDIVAIARFDMSRIHMSIGYQPNEPLSINEWMKQSQALAIINGGYFDEKNKPTGLLVANGQTSGGTYHGFGGMLAVDASGQVSLRSLSQYPYDPGSEQLQQATQSSPMLILDGKRTEFQANAASERRSVVAMDKQGRLLFIVSPGGVFSLDEMADLLLASGLEIETALNLDGGASTGLYVGPDDKDVVVDAFTALPIVIVIKK